jgi:hypothetical protein
MCTILPAYFTLIGIAVKICRNYALVEICPALGWRSVLASGLAILGVSAPDECGPRATGSASDVRIDDGTGHEAAPSD